MFGNLRYELARKGMTIKELAEKIDRSYDTVKKKMKGKFEFTRKEMLAIQKEFPGCTVTYLFDLDKLDDN